MIFSGHSNIGAAIKLEQRPAAPAPAHTAMAGADLCAGLMRGDLHRTAEAMAFTFAGLGSFWGISYGLSPTTTGPV